MKPPLADLIAAREHARDQVAHALEVHMAAVADFERAARIVAADFVHATLVAYQRAVQEYVEASRVVIAEMRSSPQGGNGGR